ncbi:MFS transporter [Sphaerisporangium krabiense]|uniref:MFS family permease n=1 Tax=Sphaerisporangium krabiense TaxID=763782 RepID=A0A7W9DNZ8_9ACTN|nr:MFS transporter [Sphaerisporangium krabiense]MBB5625868.1 MFS family permease [Sphaerisporangium krabiense]GII64671.1 MFS transporter [Sphaerisporangium krabiense]
MTTNHVAGGHTGARAGGPDERWSARWVGRLIVLVLVSEVIPVSMSLAGTALPAISGEYRTTQASWTLTAAFLAAAVAMPLIGKIADIVGKKKVLLIVLGCTTIGSVVSALAPSFLLFAVGRAMQGAAFALVFLCYSLIRDLFPPRLVTFAVSVTVTGTGLIVIGQPFLAGWLIDGYGVGGVFWFLAVLTTVLLALSAAVVPESGVRVSESRPDFAGAALLGFGVAAILLGVSIAPELGFLSLPVVALVLAGLALVVCWVFQARRVAQPLIDLRLLGSRSLLPIVAGGGLVYGAGASITLVLPILAMTPREIGAGYGFGLTATGYALFGMASGAGLVVGGLLVGLTARQGARRHLIIASGVLILGTIASALFKADYAMLMVATTIAALGLGVGSAAIPNLVIESVPPERQVISSSIVEVSRTLIASIVTPVVFVVMNSNIARVAGGQPIYTTGAFDGAYLAVGLTIAAGGAVSLLIRRRTTGDPSPSPVPGH